MGSHWFLFLIIIFICKRKFKFKFTREYWRFWTPLKPLSPKGSASGTPDWVQLISISNYYYHWWTKILVLIYGRISAFLSSRETVMFRREVLYLRHSQRGPIDFSYNWLLSYRERKLRFQFTNKYRNFWALGLLRAPAKPSLTHSIFQQPGKKAAPKKTPAILLTNSNFSNEWQKLNCSLGIKKIKYLCLLYGIRFKIVNNFCVGLKIWF